jgi:FkbM family methyltransferase
MNILKKTIQYIKSLDINNLPPIYNLNWIKPKNFYSKILKSETIHLIDLGARWGSIDELKSLEKHIYYVGFDADQKEIKKLQSYQNNYKHKKYIHAFISEKKGVVNFFLYKKAAASSVYKYKKSFIDWFQNDIYYIDKEVEMNSSSLDEMTNIDVDIIKLDTQGNEFEILNGGSEALEKTLMVECEVEFYEIYDGQKLSHDILKKMHFLGFEVLYLNRVFSSSKNFEGISRGQIIFGEVLFGLSRERASKLTKSKKIKYCALLINYGHIDFAFDIYNESPELKDQIELGKFFKEKNKKLSKFKKLFILLIDKLIFTLLKLRKTNGSRCDSDRSWPYR